jgi:hypothetical protein
MNVGWVLADRSNGTRVLLKTTDSGTSWATTSAPDVTGAAQVLFADTTNGWIVGDNGLQSTHDGGATWATATVPGGIPSGAAVATAAGKVHVSYLGGTVPGVTVASSPIDHDAFVPTGVSIPSGAGPILAVSMSAGGPYGELIYTDRTFIGAMEISSGQWARWDLSCPYANPVATAGLSPQGQALAIACSPSGFGDNAAVVGANLSTGTLSWTTIEPAGDSTKGEPMVDLAAATDAGARIIVFTKADGTAEIVTSTDGGATWPTRTPLPAGTSPLAITHLPDGSLLLSINPSGGLASADGLTWTPVATTPI